jgi:TPR repeat protein
LGLAASENNVGWHYYKGDGIKRSIPDAVFWITRSAEQGEPFAYGSLCEMYDAGDTFAKDNIEAYKWCKLAANEEPDGQVRSGSVCLNSLLGPDKWMTAFVMLPAGLPTAY